MRDGQEKYKVLSLGLSPLESRVMESVAVEGFRLRVNEISNFKT